MEDEVERLWRSEIASDPSRVLFLLDGFDEVASSVLSSHLRAVWKKILTFPHLITSRPTAVHELQFDRRLEVLLPANLTIAHFGQLFLLVHR